MGESRGRHIIAERSNGKIVLTHNQFKGLDLVDIRKLYLKGDGTEGFTKNGISLHPHEAHELCRVLGVVLGSLSVEPEDLAIAGEDSEGLASYPSLGHLNLQDRLLLYLAEGFLPEDAGKLIFGNGKGIRRRITELGKALRRSGHLIPGAWIPTPKGESHVNDLHRGMIDCPGEEEAQNCTNPPRKSGSECNLPRKNSPAASIRIRPNFCLIPSEKLIGTTEASESEPTLSSDVAPAPVREDLQQQDNSFGPLFPF